MCGKKKTGSSSPSFRKSSPSDRKPASSKIQSSTSKSTKCAECERFDTRVDAAINSHPNISISNTNGRCIINGYEITPKTCEHGNGRDIVIDRLGLHMNAYGGMSIGGCYSSMGNGNQYNRSKAGECSECQRYDQEVAAASKATVTRDEQGNMVITGSSGINVVKRNGQTYVNQYEIQRRNCQHRSDINGCVVYDSSNLNGMHNCIFYYCSKVKGDNGVYYKCSDVVGNNSVFNTCSTVAGNNCVVNYSTNVTGNNCVVNYSANVTGNNCVFNNSSNVKGRNNVLNNSTGGN